MSLTLEERLKYYCGDFFNKKHNIKVSEKYKTFKQNEIYYYLGPNNYPPNFKFTHGSVKPGWWWCENHGFIVDFPCLTNSADGYNSDELPVLTKARIIGEKNNGILLKYEYWYHWLILENFNDSVLWEDKLNSIVWRGNTYTGHSKKYNRQLFVDTYYKNHNVGYSGINESISIEKMKGRLTVEEQLKYKYLIVIEGNDVATSLKWSLQSNSIVIMSKPIIEGWLMEGLLKPYVHYVPLKDDFSDLEEIIEWCKLNDDECKKISKNASEYMLQFMNKDNEMLLHTTITTLYKKNVTLY